MIEFKLRPVDTTPVHEELMDRLGGFLYNLPVGSRKSRGAQVGPQVVDIICLFDEVLKKHGLKVVKTE